MEHVVFFPAPDGSPAFRRMASLEDAARLVEHLRNVEGVGEVSVHALGAEVPLAFRTWYRVELPQSPAGEEPQVEPADVVAQVPQQVSEPVEEHAARVELAPLAEDVPVLAPEPVDDVVAQPEVQEDPVPALSSNGLGDGPKSLGFFAT